MYDDEEGVYSEGAREESVEDGSMSPEEGAFMQGYDEEEDESVTCTICGDKIENKTKALKKKTDDETIYFCSDDCVEEYEEE